MISSIQQGMQSLQPQLASLAALPPPAQPAVVLPSVSAPVSASASQDTSSSSPVSGGGVEDTHRTVAEFFKWLVSQQPLETRGPYEQAARVAIEELWHVKDLRAMSRVKGDLHTLAIEHFKLKDGVVRHLRDDLKRYKRVLEASKTLSSMAGSGAGVGEGTVA